MSTPTGIDAGELRRRALLANSAGSSGTSTPIQKTESEINLTKPSLYSIYNEDSVLEFDSKDDEDDPPIRINPVPIREDKQAVDKRHTPHAHGGAVVVARTLAKVAILAAAAAIYNLITEQIRNNHLMLNKETFKPLYLTQAFINHTIRTAKPLTLLSSSLDHPVANYIVVVTIQGLIMGSVHPLLDFLMEEPYSRRLLSSNPDQKSWRNSNLMNDLLRSLITFLGISYAIRNIEWSSSLQVSIVWSMLDPGLWLLLDGTVSGFIASLTVAIWGCLAIFITNVELLGNFTQSFIVEDHIATWLWTGSFFFCGLIIFGKIGRALLSGQ